MIYCIIFTGKTKWLLEKLTNEDISSIPLIIPNCYEYDSASNAIKPATGEQSAVGEFTLNEAAVKLIESINAEQISVVSICGPYRSGKSFFLVQVVGRK